MFIFMDGLKYIQVEDERGHLQLQLCYQREV